MRKILLCYFFLILIFYTSKLSGKHIVGGDATYSVLKSDGYLGGNATYRVKINIYRDALTGGAEFDSPGFIGIYYKKNNQWVYLDTINRNITNKQNIPNVDDPCVVNPTDILYEKGEYIFDVQLKIIDAPYQITYQRCCRTNIIVNIFNPEATGATYYVTISPESQLLKNNSPYFASYPPAVFCLYKYFEVDNHAFDIDGDSLVYEFFNPISGGGLNGSTAGTAGNQYLCDGVQPLPINCPPPYAPVVYKSPFSFTNPMMGNPQIIINSRSGLITGTPEIKGQFVLGVQVKEYRNGVLIGTIQRDFQFNVIDCYQAVNAVIGNSKLVDDKEFEVFVCGQDTVKFKNKSHDINKIVNQEWIFDINGTKITSMDWEPSIVFPGPGSYFGKLILNKGIKCSDSASINVRIYPAIKADYSFKFDSCNIKPITFNNLSYSEAGPLTGWKWNFGDNTTGSDFSPTHQFEIGDFKVRLIVQDKNNCKDTLDKNIKFFPVPEELEIYPSKFLSCQPANINFNTSIPDKYNSYSFNWNFGDGSFGNEIHPLHHYENPGDYTATLKLISPTNCSIENDINNPITVKESPIADFDYTPQQITITNPTIQIINLSKGGTYHLWDFGTGDISYEFEPKYTYLDTGLYYITYIVTSENRCTDTLSKRVEILPELTMFFPNAFTPNGDGKNDYFFGKTLNVKYIKDFKIVIFDRWGGLVFESNDPQEYWNGAKFNSGNILPQGVYVYNYSYKTTKNKKIENKGFVTIVK